MASSPILTARVRDLLERRRGVTEKRMFGGTAFMLFGNLLVGIWNDGLIARIGVDQAASALKRRHVGPMDITGRPMKGWVIVAPEGIDSDQQLKGWLDLAFAFVSTLEPKA